MNNNTTTSPLYDLVKTKLKYKTRKYLGSRTIQIVTDAISYVINNCCVKNFPKSEDPFVVMVYVLLKQMQGPEYRQKLIAVRDLLLENCYAPCTFTSTIEFVVNTTNDTFFSFDFTTSTPINFSIDWGDGTIHLDSGAGGFYEETHTYAQPNREYTVRVYFDNVDSVIALNFPGD
jgi:hypothetical protein